MKRHFCFVLILSFTVSAFANAGTPLMLVGFFHLAFGNALIGVLEAVIGQRRYGLTQGRSLVAMISANYASMAIGWLLLSFGANRMLDLVDDPLITLKHLLWASPVLAFALTVLLEWPFCWMALKGQHARVRRSLQFSALANTASYLLILPVYYYTSFGSLGTTANVVTELTSMSKSRAWVYFIEPGGTEISRIRLDRSQKEPVTTSSEVKEDQILFAEADDQGYDLCLGWEDDRQRPSFTTTTLLSRFSSNTTATIQPGWDRQDRPVQRGRWFSFGIATDLRPLHDQRLQVRTGFWPGQGITISSSVDTLNRRYALETPFAAWAARSASVLPGDIIVVEFDGNIVVVDGKEGAVSFLVRGSSPVVTLD